MPWQLAARHLVQRVLAGGPEGEIAIAAVATQANGRLLAGGAALAEGIGRLGLHRVLQVLGGIAVAGLAHAAVGVVFRAVRGEVDRVPLVFVAVRADRPGRRLLRRLRRHRLCRRRGRRPQQNAQEDCELVEAHLPSPFAALAGGFFDTAGSTLASRLRQHVAACIVRSRHGFAAVRCVRTRGCATTASFPHCIKHHCTGAVIL